MAIPIIAGGNILASDFTGTRYWSFNPAMFKTIGGTTAPIVMVMDIQTYIKSASDTLPATCVCGVNLPHGAIVTGFKVFWYRANSSDSGVCRLRRARLTFASDDEMANADAVADGETDPEDTTIIHGTISNNYSYYIIVLVDPNNFATNMKFYGGWITFTIDNPKP